MCFFSCHLMIDIGRGSRRFHRLVEEIKWMGGGEKLLKNYMFIYAINVPKPENQMIICYITVSFFFLIFFLCVIFFSTFQNLKGVPSNLWIHQWQDFILGLRAQTKYRSQCMLSVAKMCTYTCICNCFSRLVEIVLLIAVIFFYK